VKIQYQVEKNICDVDGCKEIAYGKCMRCGTDICLTHQPIVGKNYRHSATLRGGEDGYFCNACISKLISDPNEPLREIHEAYLGLDRLIKKINEINKEYDVLIKHAEESIQKLWKKTKNIREMY